MTGQNVNSRGTDGYTALHVAAGHDQAGAVHALVDARANIESKSSLGYQIHASRFYFTGAGPPLDCSGVGYKYPRRTWLTGGRPHRPVGGLQQQSTSAPDRCKMGGRESRTVGDDGASKRHGGASANGSGPGQTPGRG